MKDNSFSIHERNIQSLAMEIYDFLDGLSPNFLAKVFHKNISVAIFDIIKNFVPEITRQLDMELKLFRIEHLKPAAKFQKILKCACR